MPYPTEVPILSEEDFICTSGDRYYDQDTNGVNREQHLESEQKNCLIEFANLHFGSRKDYYDTGLGFDWVWDSVPKRVYQSIREAILEVYGPSHVGIDADPSDLDYELSNEISNVSFENTQQYLKEVEKIVKQEERNFLKDVEDEKKQYIEKGDIPDANDAGCSVRNAKVWNLAMKKLGYEA